MACVLDDKVNGSVRRSSCFSSEPNVKPCEGRQRSTLDQRDLLATARLDPLRPTSLPLRLAWTVRSDG